MPVGLVGGLAAGIGEGLTGLASTALQGFYNRQEAAKSRAFTAEQNQLERDFNAQQAEIARQFEERMSSTAYQRSKADMELAGINPALQFLNSSGAASASTPSGQAASAGGSGATSAASITPAKIDPVRTFLEVQNAAAQSAATKAKMEDLGVEREYKRALTFFYDQRRKEIEDQQANSARDKRAFEKFDQEASKHGMTADDYASYLGELSKSFYGD